MQTILVIGGAGFIGSHTVVELAQAGFRPVIVDNFSNSEPAVIKRLEKLLDQKLTCYEQDYRESDKIAAIIKKEQAIGIIHFAAFKAVGESVEQPLKYYDNNVSGFIALLQTVTDLALKHFVFSSSAAVYGNPPTPKVNEETVLNPASPYGWSKYMDEIILEDTCSANLDLNGTALRYFNVVGAHESALIGELPKGKPQNLLPIIVQAVTGKIPPLTVYGNDYATPDGTCLRDYVHVVDLAKAHVAALNKSLHSHGGYTTYNVGTGKPTSVLELIKTFEKVNGIAVPYHIGERRPGDPETCYASVEKAEKELKWKASKTTADAVADAWRWHKASNKSS